MKRGTKQVGIGVLTGLLLFVFTCTAAWAQSTAQINGTVKDQSGAVLARRGSHGDADRHGREAEHANR